MDENEKAKIGDFGLAKLLEKTDQTNTLCGTVGYMAPEVCKVNLNYFFPKNYIIKYVHKNAFMDIFGHIVNVEALCVKFNLFFSF